WESTAVVNGEFVQLKLADYLGKYLVFSFIHWTCKFCLYHLAIGLKNLNRKINTEVVACSVDYTFYSPCMDKHSPKEGWPRED
ncbi:hypothetical protein NQ317_002296, partial [Molorchus minor]